MRISRSTLLVAAAFLLTACGAPAPPAVVPPPAATPRTAPVALEFLGAVTLEPGQEVEGSRVGGLSALAWQPSTGLWYALSDDRGRFAPARFYTLRLDLADGRLQEGDVEWVGATLLRDTGGRPFATGSVDPEGLALSPRGTLFVSSEGDAGAGVAPFVREMRLDGSTLRQLALPEAYLPDAGGQRGVRDNLALEALTLSPDGTVLFTASENALAQDGPAADLGSGSRARILLLAPAAGAAGAVLAEHVYPVEPVGQVPVPADAYRSNGLVELLALSDTRLLALERAFSVGRGFVVRLYEVSLDGAADVAGLERLPPESSPRAAPVTKRLLFDFTGLPAPLFNVEGMAFGPELPDGRRTLVMVADDNFDDQQRTQFFAFALGRRTAATPAPPAPTALSPAAVQGRGPRSPRLGEGVVVEGVVTAVRPATRSRPAGFWLQDPAGDADPATSDALVVELAAGAPLTVSPGDRVRLAGEVQERGAWNEPPVTTLAAAADRLQVLEGGLPLPAPLPVGGTDCPPGPLPAASAWWEAREGMRLVLAAPEVVGPTSRYRDAVVVAAGCAAAATRTTRGGLLLAGEDDVHPQRVVLPGVPDLAVGQQAAAPVTGVLDFAFGNHRLAAVEALPAFSPAPPAADPTALASGPEHLTVATFNVENLSAAGADDEFAALAEVLVDGLGAPAVVGLQEVQDDSGPADDGTVAAAATLARLTAAVEAAGGPRYVARQVDPRDNADGGQPGGNIRVAWLVDPARVEVVDRAAADGRPAGADDATAVVAGPGGVPRLTLSPGRVAPLSPAFTEDAAAGTEASRKPLALEARFGGVPLFLVGVHFRSKGGDDPLLGLRQPPVYASETQRLAQAEEVARLVEALLAIDPRAAVVVLGDLNEFPFRAPVRRLAAAGLVNLVEHLEPPERYTYVYQGNSQVLDQVLVSPALAAEAEVDAVHVHADFPDGARASDHDPLVVRLRVPAPEPG
ncbi:MAG TPA: esterase-like activity of phytase family protein [Thermoanaerobaculia bacterium]|nr:esterase-like activity of phytase family protein [Thermoanaerobaculia bacterium]